MRTSLAQLDVEASALQHWRRVGTGSELSSFIKREDYDVKVQQHKRANKQGLTDPRCCGRACVWPPGLQPPAGPASASAPRQYRDAAVSGAARAGRPLHTRSAPLVRQPECDNELRPWLDGGECGLQDVLSLGAAPGGVQCGHSWCAQAPSCRAVQGWSGAGQAAPR